jgi:hypothetical protein
MNALENAIQKKEIANTIIKQIHRHELCAIGARNLTSMSSTPFGGLMFDAALFGRKKCKVAITLTADDLYDICIFTGPSLKCFASAKGVFAEDLTEIVVDLVEKRFAA